MYLFELMLSDSLVKGAGGIVVGAILLTPDEVDAIHAMVTSARKHRGDTNLDAFLFRTTAGALIDTRCVVGSCL
jgi:hypothetical protein